MQKLNAPITREYSRISLDKVIRSFNYWRNIILIQSNQISPVYHYNCWLKTTKLLKELIDAVGSYASLKSAE
jgi:hypothetical protein